MAKKTTPIAELELQLSQLNDKRVKLIDEINDYNDRNLVPGLIKQHVGKFYKYRNSYNKETGWWLYSHCIGIESSHFGVFNCFEVSPQQCEFRINHQSGFHLCERKITKREYNAALNKFLFAADKLKP